MTRRGKASLFGLALVVVVVALFGLRSLLWHAGVELDGQPLRLAGFLRAWLSDGCYPERQPIACRVDGRPWRVQNAGRSWAVADEPGSCGQRFELRGGDRWPKDVRTRHMTERNELADIVRQPFGTDIWLAFSMMIEPGPVSTAAWMNFGQLHNTPDAGENNVSQIFVHGFDAGDRYVVKVRGSSENPLRSSPEPAVLFTDAEFRRGHRYRYVIRLRLDPQGAGVAQIWRDGIQIADYRGPLGYLDRFGPYFKYGLYRRIAPGGETVVGHFSCLRLGPTREAVADGEDGGP